RESPMLPYEIRVRLAAREHVPENLIPADHPQERVASRSLLSCPMFHLLPDGKIVSRPWRYTACHPKLNQRLLEGPSIQPTNKIDDIAARLTSEAVKQALIFVDRETRPLIRMKRT